MIDENNILKWLDEAGCRRVKVSGANATCTCPFHKDNTPSFSMHIQNGMWICFACGEKGNIGSFLYRALDWTWEKIKGVKGESSSYLLENDIEFRLPEWDELKKTHDLVKKVDVNLLAYRYCPKYLIDRGFKKETLLRYEVGFDFYTGRIVLPVRNKNQDILGFMSRAVAADCRPKYKLEFTKKDVLYGENEVLGTSKLVVTEGPLDTIAVAQSSPGVDAVATLGAAVTLGQMKKLLAYEQVLLYRDMDEPGRTWTSKIGEYLLPRMKPNSIKVVTKYNHDSKDMAEEMAVGGTDAGVQLANYENWRITI